MTRDTDAFIRRLAGEIEPVRPLPNPWTRAGAWLALSVVYVALVVFVMSPRADLVLKMLERRFVIEQAAAFATGVVAAAAAFASVVPGYSRGWLAMPLLPLSVWLGTLGYGCIEDGMRLGPAGLSLQSDWFCLPAIAVVGAMPAVAMALMLRRGAPLAPRAATALGGLAAAGLGDFGLRLFHTQDAGVMVLVWQFGAVCVLTAAAAAAGRHLLHWRSRRRS
jgi:hypothetical protein